MMGAVMFSVGMLMSSCWRKQTCDCVKRVGCSTMLATQVTNDSVVATALICADSTVDGDSTYLQGVRAFGEKYSGYLITKIDTNIKVERVENLSFGESHGYRDYGYDCVCYE